MTPGSRSALLLKLADRIEQQGPEFARVESLNVGKPYARMLGDEIPGIVDNIRFFAGAARCLTGLAAGRGGELLALSIQGVMPVVLKP